MNENNPYISICADCVRNAMFECLADDSPKTPVAEADTIVEAALLNQYASVNLELIPKIVDDAARIAVGGEYFVFNAANESFSFFSEVEK